VDARCTAEGVLKVPVDEGGEAHPIHMVEAIKVCLKEVYAEAHNDDAPAWKQVEIMMKAQHTVVNNFSSAPLDTTLVTFQRKIIPLDALNLSLEEIKEKRTRNAARRKKQDLIVCASLIDKVPNLAGLARTSEIFAVDRLVVPDRTVTKMDNFSSISVGAGDWIEIEECREQVRQAFARGKTAS
jgi:tRNA G18 (ribose-2'-O)-methylase SpoU